MYKVRGGGVSRFFRDRQYLGGHLGHVPTIQNQESNKLRSGARTNGRIGFKFKCIVEYGKPSALDKFQAVNRSGYGAIET
jgi:hypothetical protein